MLENKNFNNKSLKLLACMCSCVCVKMHNLGNNKRKQWLTWSSRGRCWVSVRPESGSAQPCTEGWSIQLGSSTAEATPSDCAREAWRHTANLVKTESLWKFPTSFLNWNSITHSNILNCNTRFVKVKPDCKLKLFGDNDEPLISEFIGVPTSCSCVPLDSSRESFQNGRSKRVCGWRWGNARWTQRHMGTAPTAATRTPGTGLWLETPL